MRWRRALRAGAYVGLGLAAAVMGIAAGCETAQGGYNAVLVILDTTRWDAVGCYREEGGVGISPHLDRLAARGVRFTEAEAQNPYTLGSVATILTSLDPDLHGLKANSGFRLDPQAVTLAEVFRDAGYRTGGFVSAFPLRKASGLDQGFDVYDDDFSMVYPVYDAQYVPIQEERRGAERRGDETLRRAAAWLEGQPKNAPFFLLVHLYDPHQPYDPPPPFLERHPGKPYEGEVAFADSLVGRLLQVLEERSLSEKTVVSVVADHGEGFREHNEVGHGFLLYETTLRVPWILAGPGIPRAEVEGPVPIVDVAPTLLSACGLEVPPAYKGTDHAGRVTAEGTIAADRGAFYQETYYPRTTHRWSELLGWRKGQWKYIRGPRTELFDLSLDPPELNNVAERESLKTAALASELDAYLARSGAQRLTPIAETPDEETLEKLRSLGYTGGAAADAKDLTPGWELGLADPRDAVIGWNRGQDARAFYRLSLMHYEAARYAEALRWADQAILADTTHLDAVYMRCKSLESLGRLDEAIQHYGALLALRPEDVASWIGLGIALDRTGAPDKAQAAFAAAVRLDPSSPDANFNLGSFLARRERPAEAVPYYEAVRALLPSDVALRGDLARIYLALGRGEEAESVLEEARAIDPDEPSVLLLLGMLDLEKGRTEEGRGHLERFLKLHPGRPEAAEVRRVLGSL